MKEIHELVEITLQIKLASLIVHVEEMMSPKGHVFDKSAIQALLDDAEVRRFMDGIDPVFLPVKR